ncbi:Bifunctional inhibitor/plant lipid transfer protein/seed storage helical domain containing protein [Trema orientale]|uniref:Bifunctional inhibitor/plant lipid transfer protein/seed storage helical domain containing protein n=1 Tax=Trema orientale TaxID=63057 RepID=A0A2P5AJ37_TREOI|nr:Bifunctional inhibitor/plant lipid transfer protein/seed storage helical domain containing protein [Trema orientale]
MRMKKNMRDTSIHDHDDDHDGGSFDDGQASRVANAVVICSPVEMDPCKEAIATTASPSSICCRMVREQRPCLCGYLNDPNLRPTINSPNARRVASICGVELFPTCY